MLTFRVIGLTGHWKKENGKIVEFATREAADDWIGRALGKSAGYIDAKGDKLTSDDMIEYGVPLMMVVPIESAAYAEGVAAAKADIEAGR